MKDVEVLCELADEMTRGHIYERPLRVPGWHLDGVVDGRRVYVDPAPSVVEGLLHELCHRRFPHWSEAHVSRVAHRILMKMSSSEVRRWYRDFQRVARKSNRPHDLDEVE